ncbi:hypothetical protein [Neisseria leonii]|uniref:hypothetical protein n=1 Tax=Neisseria leonii TaxID=2995413 RepID=UPI00237ABC66|nr:hypothetical protein [Neisseria sp. 3986]MDD9325020.1 hypothetical protein [Neisseria sp. 3986]
MVRAGKEKEPIIKVLPPPCGFFGSGRRPVWRYNRGSGAADGLYFGRENHETERYHPPNIPNGAAGGRLK